MRRGSRIAIALVLLLVIAASLWWQIAPPRSDSGYREEAAKSAESMISHLETARLWAQGIADDEVTEQSASIGIEEAETDASSTASSFESVQPPEGQTELRAAYTTLASDATDLLGRLRIAARRGEWGRVPDERDDLQDVTRRFEDFVLRARP